MSTKPPKPQGRPSGALPPLPPGPGGRQPQRQLSPAEAALLQRLKQGAALHEAGRLQEAANVFQSILKDQPRQSDALYWMGVIAAQSGQLVRGIEFLERAVKEQPGNAFYRSFLGYCYLQNADMIKAVVNLEKAVAAQPEFITARLNLAEAYNWAGRNADSLALSQKTLETRPGDPRIQVAIATSLSNLGRMDEAASLYREVIAKSPRYCEAYEGLATAQKFGKDDHEIKAIEALLTDASLQTKDRESLHYAAGKIYNDVKDYDQAFKHYNAAKAITAAGYDIRRYISFVDQAESVYTKDFLASWHGKGHKSERPVFIVGMPRSGTTLTEQVISSHPKAHGAGERNDMQRICTALINRLGGTLELGPKFDGLKAHDLKASAETYLEMLNRHSATAQRVTDKMPHNYESLGLISMFFPNAKIIHCVRDPIDTCVSCFMQHFHSAHGYNAGLESLGRYYREYVRLMDHWKRVLPIPIFEVRYEDMIADQEAMTRKLIDFVALPWDDACLRFYETERAVTTPSRWQVRQPIYGSSVKRWKNYEQHLTPLITALGDLADVS